MEFFMMDVAERATTAIYAAIDDLNEQLPEGLRLEKIPSTALLDKTGSLDSVSFISLVVLVEERCQDEFGVSLSLTDEERTGPGNPFQTIGSLVAHVSRLIDESRTIPSK